MTATRSALAPWLTFAVILAAGLTWLAHSSVASGQRGWNEQPLGSLPGSGIVQVDLNLVFSIIDRLLFRTGRRR